MSNAKKKLLEKAFLLFISKNYDSVTINEIQKAAKVSRGAVYHHFKSKEDIYEQVVNEFLLPSFSSYSSVENEEKKTLLNTIYSSIKCKQNHMNLIKEISKSKISDYQFFKFVYEATEHSQTFKEEVNLLVEKEFNSWRNIIKNAIQSNEIRSDIDIDYVAQYFVMSPLGLGNFSAFNKYIINIDTNIRTNYLKFYNFLINKSIY